MSSEFRTVFIDHVPVPTTSAGAAAVELLQAKLREAKGVVDGLSGQLDALKSIRQEETSSNLRRPAAQAHDAMVRRMGSAWRNPPNAGA